MNGVLFAIALVNALVVAVITWGVARRYGMRSAFLVPIGGIVAIALVTWRNAGADAQVTMGLISVALIIVGPWALGAFIGLVIAHRQRR